MIFTRRKFTGEKKLKMSTMFNGTSHTKTLSSIYKVENWCWYEKHNWCWYEKQLFPHIQIDFFKGHWHKIMCPFI